MPRSERGERANSYFKRFFAVIKHTVFRREEFPFTTIDRVFEVANQTQVVAGNALEDSTRRVVRELQYLRARVVHLDEIADFVVGQRFSRGIGFLVTGDNLDAIPAIGNGLGVP